MSTVFTVGLAGDWGAAGGAYATRPCSCHVLGAVRLNVRLTALRLGTLEHVRTARMVIARTGAPLRAAIIDATLHRVRPILLTAAAAILAMIPLCRSVFWGPMAYATMGGLFVATFLTLFFLPALYQFAFQNQDPPLASETAE